MTLVDAFDSHLSAWAGMLDAARHNAEVSGITDNLILVQADFRERPALFPASCPQK